MVKFNRLPTPDGLTLGNQPQTAAPAWMRPVLLLAAAYNLFWGTLAILLPTAPFEWIGVAPPNYPALVQCIGMVVGVYGVGYAIAASDPLRHWPLVLVGLLGKVLGPIGFAYAAALGQFPWVAGVTVLTNDMLWWLPFGLILYYAWRANRPAGSHKKTLGPGSQAYDRGMSV